MKTILQLILLFATAELCTLLHELGHAAGILLSSREKVLIRLGLPPFDKDKRLLQLGRLSLQHGGFMPFYGVTYVNEEALNRRQLLLFFLGGPLLSLLLSGLAFAAAARWGSGSAAELLRFAGTYLLIQFFITALPLRYPQFPGPYAGMKSDGLYILELLPKRK